MNKKLCQITTSDLILCEAYCQATWNICRLLGNSYKWQTASSLPFPPRLPSPAQTVSPPRETLIPDPCVLGGGREGDRCQRGLE